MIFLGTVPARKAHYANLIVLLILFHLANFKFQCHIQTISSFKMTQILHIGAYFGAQVERSYRLVSQIQF